MSILAVEQFSETYYPQATSRWTDLIAPMIALIVLTPMLIWLLRFLNRALRQSKSCLEHNVTAIDLSRESIVINHELIDLSRELLEVQRESNRLLAQLNESLKNRPHT